MRGKNGSVGTADYGFTNLGTIRADVAVGVAAGGISVTGPGWSNLGTLSAANGGILLLSGTDWTNGGTISIPGPTGGSVYFAGSWTNTATITATRGTLSLGGSSWSNSGIIRANGDGSGAPTVILGNATTAGLGTYDFTGVNVLLQGTLINSGSTLRLDFPTAGNWTIQGGALVGGVVRGASGVGLRCNYYTPATLNGVILDTITLNMATPLFVNQVNVLNGLTLNNSTILVGADSGTSPPFGTLVFQGTQRLDGTGTVVFGGSSFNALNVAGSSGSRLTLGPNITVRGKNGTLGSRGYGLTNEGSVAADVADGVFDLRGDWTSNGVLSASNGATLTVADGNTVAVSDLTFDSGTLRLGNDSGTTWGVLTFQGTQTLDGDGTVIFGGSNNNAITIAGDPGSTLTIAPGVIVRGNNGSIGSDGYDLMNQGLVTADVDAGTLTAQGSWTNTGTVAAQNGGTLKFRDTPANYVDGYLVGGTWRVFDNSTFCFPTLLSIHGIDGGAYFDLEGPNSRVVETTGLDLLREFQLIGTDSILELHDGRYFLATIQVGDFVNSGELRIASSDCQFDLIFDQEQGTAANLGSLYLTGSLNVVNRGLLNTGNVIALYGTLTLAGNYTQADGGTTVLVDGTLTTPGLVDIQGGVLSGTGTINASMHNAGQINVGTATAAGLLTINGDYTQTATGALALKVGGPGPGTDSDQLVVAGQATLDGALSVSLVNGFTPASGDVFQILTTGSLSGAFADTSNIDPAFQQPPTYDPTGVTLQAV